MIELKDLAVILLVLVPLAILTIGMALICVKKMSLNENILSKEGEYVSLGKLLRAACILLEYDKKKILIVDDLNDSGATINWIMNDWMDACKKNSPAWDDVWGKAHA